MPRLVSIFGLALLAATLTFCGRAPDAERRRSAKLRPADHAKSLAARLAALRMDHATAGALLAGHHYKAVHRVRVTLDGQPDRSFVDHYELRCTGKGDCHGRQDNSLEYGVEFYRVGEHTYFRHRYQRFLRFTEEPAEARRRADRIWGTGAAVVELLLGHLKTTPAGEVTVAGRSGIRYKLSRGRGVAQSHTGRRRWRARLKAQRIEGEAVLDKSTGAPLSLRVSYAVSAPKGGRTVTITGTFDGSVSEAHKPQVIKPPADFAVARARPRDSRDLRMLGSHRLNPGWFRGGGPQAAHRAGRGGAARSSARRPRPRPRRPRSRPVMSRPSMAAAPGKP